MTKQEMAEWLAEKVLGWEKDFDGVWQCSKNQAKERAAIWGSKLQGVIYSPEGFFAVIKKLKNSFPNEKASTIVMTAWIQFLDNQDYEAFYNAVYEAFKA